MEEKVYLFKVSLESYHSRKKIYREIALKGKTSLYEFAEIITDAFNFDLDHAFGFYSDTEDIYESDEAYTLFYDTDSLVNEPNEKSVKNNYIHSVFNKHKIMVFLFDYGAGWEFLVKRRGISDADAGNVYPKVVKKQGEAPPQYPDEEISDESS